MTISRLARLVAPATLESLLAAADGLAPGAMLSIRDAGGHEVARHGPTDARSDAAVATRSIRLGDVSIGQVLVEGSAGSAVAESVATLVAASISAVAAEADARRDVTTAALDDLRELALVSRLAQLIATASDPSEIAGGLLEAISRPLRPDAAIVLADDGATELASSGDARRVGALRAAGAPLLEQLRAEDPVEGSCAEIGPGDPAAAGLVGVVLAAFLRTASGNQGSILLGRAPGEPLFSAGDKRLVASVASQAATALERAAMQQEILSRRRLDDELSIGRRIQRSLMPRRFPEIPGWEFAAAYEAAREVGGDLYDVFPLRDRPGMLAFAVADVTGKGIPAAILMADARALIHAAADHATDPVDSLDRVNRVLRQERGTTLFVTVAHGTIDGATGEVVLAGAGHEPLHLVHPDGALATLELGGRMVGMVGDLGAHVTRLTMAPGDELLVHTDGVTEARSPDGGFYGDDRFEALLATLGDRSAAEVVEAVVDAVATFRAGAEPSDDLTLLVIRRLPEGRADRV